MENSKALKMFINFLNYHFPIRPASPVAFVLCWFTSNLLLPNLYVKEK